MATSKKGPPCPVCHRPMTVFSTGPKCMNVKAHNMQAGAVPGGGQGVGSGAGQRRPGVSRHRKGKKK